MALTAPVRSSTAVHQSSGSSTHRLAIGLHALRALRFPLVYFRVLELGRRHPPALPLAAAAASVRLTAGSANGRPSGGRRPCAAGAWVRRGRVSRTEGPGLRRAGTRVAIASEVLLQAVRCEAGQGMDRIRAVVLPLWRPVSKNLYRSLSLSQARASQVAWSRTQLGTD